MNRRTDSLPAKIKELQGEIKDLSSRQYFGSDMINVQKSGLSSYSTSVDFMQTKKIRIRFTYDNYKGQFAQLVHSFTPNLGYIDYDIYQSPDNVEGANSISWILLMFNGGDADSISFNFSVLCIDTGVTTVSVI